MEDQRSVPHPQDERSIGVKSQPSVPHRIMTRSQTGTVIRPPDRLESYLPQKERCGVNVHVWLCIFAEYYLRVRRVW